MISSMIFIMAGCSAYQSWQYLPDSPQDERIVFIVSHGWHTGLVISTKNLGPELAFLKTHFNNSLYYEIGWGDKNFYQTKQITSGITVRAIFLPTESVVHVVSLTEQPYTYFPNSQIIPVKISRQGHRQLTHSIAQTFKKNSEGVVIQTQSGLYGNSEFFAGNGNFYITNNCNSWTAKMLAKAGVPIRTWLTLTANSILTQIDDANEQLNKKRLTKKRSYKK